MCAAGASGMKARKMGYASGDIKMCIRDRLKEGDVSGDMTELLTGKVPGREREDEIIVSTHMGMGAHDVNCAMTVYERALETGIGQKMVF